jgi:transposase
VGRGEEGLDSWHLNDAATLMTVHVTSPQRVVPRPVCAVFAHRIHNCCERILADLPWGTARVRWQLRVRTHQTYGTVLIDLERRQPVALFPYREADTLAPWLR